MYDAMADVRVERPSAGTAIVKFTGEHDLASREDLAELLDELTGDNDVVVADFSDALFVDSTMLYVLVDADAAARARGRKLRLQLGATSIVRTAFELSGLTKRLDCIQSRDDELPRPSAPAVLTAPAGD